MEFNRGYLCTIIDFYFTLQLPSVPTISDALTIWSDKFSTRELKSVLQLVAELLRANKIELSYGGDKSKALRILESYIKRISLKFRRSFKDIGSDATRCARALIHLTSSSPTAKEDIRYFRQKINNTSKCRSECNIGDFLTRRFKTEVEKYVALREKIENPTRPENHGFISFVEVLKNIIDEGIGSYTCATCSKVGDAIIASKLSDSFKRTIARSGAMW